MWQPATWFSFRVNQKRYGPSTIQSPVGVRSPNSLISSDLCADSNRAPLPRPQSSQRNRWSRVVTFIRACLRTDGRPDRDRRGIDPSVVFRAVAVNDSVPVSACMRCSRRHLLGSEEAVNFGGLHWLSERRIRLTPEFQRGGLRTPIVERPITSNDGRGPVFYEIAGVHPVDVSGASETPPDASV